MNRRRFNKAIYRIKHLPIGRDLLLYAFNKFKLIYLKKIKSAKVAYPSTIMIELTNHCNLKCITCPREYEFGSKMDKGYMDFENFKRIIDQAYPYPDSVGLSGLGETLLYNDLNKAVDYIRQKSKGIIISVSINAHLKNSPEIISQLVDKIDTIQISIDGLNDVYNKVRINGDFNFFLSNLRKIATLTKKTKTTLLFNVVVLKENYKQMSDIVRFAHDEGVLYINFTPINLVSIPSINISYYDFFQTEEFQNELKKAEETAKKYPEIEFTFPNFSKLNVFKMCHYPWGHFYITWDGYMPPCCAKPFPKELSFGNVFRDGLLNTINSESFQDFRKLWLKKEVPEFCKGC